MPVFVIHKDGVVVAVNKVSQKDFHIKDKQTLELKSFTDSIMSINGKPYQQKEFAFFKAIETKRTVENQILVISSGKQRKTYQVSAGPIMHEGEVEDVILSFKNISTEINRQYMQKMFIKMVSHELKQPLGLIKAYLYYLNRIFKRHQISGDKYITKINTQVKMITQMIDDVSDATRFNLDAFTVKKQLVDIKKLLPTIASELKTSYSERALVFEDKTPNEEILVLIDPIRIRQAISNLVVNAFKYSPEKEAVYLSLSRDRSFLTVEVLDKGMGIEPDEIEKIFMPYYRSRQGKSEGIQGLGLGLSLVKHILEKHDGEIVVKSKPRKGSLFILRIPLT